MSQDEKNTNVTLRIGLFIISLLITIVGWLTVDKLSSIDSNISDIRKEVKEQSGILHNHERRISILEEKDK